MLCLVFCVSKFLFPTHAPHRMNPGFHQFICDVDQISMHFIFYPDAFCVPDRCPNFLLIACKRTCCTAYSPADEETHGNWKIFTFLKNTWGINSCREVHFPVERKRVSLISKIEKWFISTFILQNHIFWFSFNSCLYTDAHTIED